MSLGAFSGSFTSIVFRPKRLEKNPPPEEAKVVLALVTAASFCASGAGSTTTSGDGACGTAPVSRAGAGTGGGTKAGLVRQTSHCVVYGTNCGEKAAPPRSICAGPVPLTPDVRYSTPPREPISTPPPLIFT